MAQLSAYFLLGTKEGFLRAVNQMYLLNLYEDDRDEKNIEPFYLFRPQGGNFPEDDIRMWPNPNYIYEDGVIFLTGIYLKDERIREIIQTYYEQDVGYDFRKIPESKRNEIVDSIRELEVTDHKILLTCLYQSSLTKRLKETGNPFPYVELFFSNHIW